MLSRIKAMNNGFASKFQASHDISDVTLRTAKTERPVIVAPATKGAATWRLEQNSLPSVDATDARQSSPPPPPAPMRPAQTTNTKTREQTNSTQRPRSCPTPSPVSVQPSRPPASAGVMARSTFAAQMAPVRAMIATVHFDPSP